MAKFLTLMIAGYLWGVASFAEGVPDPLPTKFSQEQGQLQSQLQAQLQSQRAEAQAGAAATSNSGGNTQSTHIVTREAAAALAQGSIFVGGNCSFGGNAGGSGRGGAGFLGLSFCTPQDNDLALADRYFAIGDYATGCAIVAKTPVGRRQAKRGITLPQCVNPPPAPTATVIEKPADCPACPNCDKAFKQCVAK